LIAGFTLRWVALASAVLLGLQTWSSPGRR
jgi:hypothetical protein